MTLRYAQYQTDSECWHIQHYYGILMHAVALSRNIQAYSGIFRTLGNLRILTKSDIPSPGIFWTRGIFNPVKKPCETFNRYVQNPAIVRTIYLGIIQPYSGIFSELHKPSICRNLAYSEFWNIQKPSITTSWHPFRILSYLRK